MLLESEIFHIKNKKRTVRSDSEKITKHIPPALSLDAAIWRPYYRCLRLAGQYLIQRGLS